MSSGTAVTKKHTIVHRAVPISLTWISAGRLDAGGSWPAAGVRAFGGAG